MYAMGNSQLSTTLEKPKLDPEGDKTACVVDIAIEGEPKDFSLNIVFCIDVSGSMSGSKLRRTKEGTRDAVKHLESGDTFDVVAFGTYADTLLGPTDGSRGGSVGNAIMNVDNRTDTSGGTDITAGLDESYDQLNQMSSTIEQITKTFTDSDEVDWIVLLTDGQDSGYNPVSKGSELASAGITVHTVGIGNYDENVVQVTAEKTKGNWKHAETADDIPRYFTNWVQQARNVIATNPQLTLTPRHARVGDIYYTVDDQVLDETTRQGDDIIVDLGDIRQGNVPELMIDLNVPSHEAADDVPLFDLQLDAQGDTLRETITGDFMFTELADSSLENPEARVKTELARTGREALDGNADDAVETLRESSEIDDETVDKIENTIQRVNQGDKEAKQDISEAIRYADE
jgi:uncharacterized protein YegL